MSGANGHAHSDGLSLVLPKDPIGVPSILNRPHIAALTARATNLAKAGSPRSAGNSSALLSAASTARRGSALSSAASAPSTPLAAARAMLAAEKEPVTAWNEQDLFGQDDFGACRPLRRAASAQPSRVGRRATGPCGAGDRSAQPRGPPAHGRERAPPRRFSPPLPARRPPPLPARAAPRPRAAHRAPPRRAPRAQAR